MKMTLKTGQMTGTNDRDKTLQAGQKNTNSGQTGTVLSRDRDNGTLAGQRGVGGFFILRKEEEATSHARRLSRFVPGQETGQTGQKTGTNRDISAGQFSPLVRTVPGQSTTPENLNSDHPGLQCVRCGQVGHLSKDCPWPAQVRPRARFAQEAAR